MSHPDGHWVLRVVDRLALEGVSTEPSTHTKLIEQPGRKDDLSCVVEYKETPEIKGRPVLHVARPDHLHQYNITHAHEEGWPWRVHKEPAIDPWVSLVDEEVIVAVHHCLDDVLHPVSC